MTLSNNYNVTVLEFNFSELDSDGYLVYPEAFAEYEKTKNFVIAKCPDFDTGNCVITMFFIGMIYFPKNGDSPAGLAMNGADVTIYLCGEKPELI